MPSNPYPPLGRADSMPSVTTEVQLPEYVTLRRRGEGAAARSEFRLEVPKRLRPKGWLATHRLPNDKTKRTGLGDLAELTAVIADAEGLLKLLHAARRRDKGVPDDAEDAKARLNRGTAPWLIARFKETDPETLLCKWQHMNADSRRNYDYAFRTILDWSAGCKPVAHPSFAQLTHQDLVKLIGKFNTKPSKQRAINVALHALFALAMFEGLVVQDVSRNLPLAKPNRRDPIAWPVEVVDAACARAVEIGQPSIALFLRIKWWFGARTRDVIKFREPQDYANGRFKFKTGKNGAAIEVEATPDVTVLIDATRPPGDHVGRYLLVNANTGDKWNERTLSRYIKDEILKPLGRTDLQPSFLRHTVMTELEELEVGDGPSAAFVGHSPSSHARMKDQHYRIKNAKLAAIARDKLVAARTKGKV